MLGMKQFPGISVTRTSTAEQVANGLTEMIMNGDLAPGTKVKETAIAMDMGISRNTVREAVRLLEQGGLIRHKMYKGTVVVEPSVAEVRELYAARMALELAAVRTPISGADLERIELEFNHLRELAQTDPPATSKELVAQDLAFHAAVVASLHSQRIDEFFSQLAKELRFYLTVLSHEETPDHVVSEHESILTHIRSRDVQAAAEDVTAHSTRNAARVEDLIELRFAGEGA